MPFVKCPSCGKAVSDRAPHCPNCGFKKSADGIGGVAEERQDKRINNNIEKQKPPMESRIKVLGAALILILLAVLVVFGFLFVTEKGKTALGAAKSFISSEKGEKSEDAVGEEIYPTKAFSITDPFFSNLKPCKRSGKVISIQSIQGQLAFGMDSLEDFELFCVGIEHHYKGGGSITMEMGGGKYIFHGFIRFKIIEKRGYVYLGGEGSVTMPNGETVQLPQ